MNKRRPLSILILISTLFYTISCHQPLAENKNASYFQASSDSYKKEWQKIDSLEKRGLAKDILSELDNLMQKASAVENQLQVFKILAYQSKHLQNIDEEALETIFQKYESKAQSSEFPMNQIFHSALAEMYLWYYQQNRWKFSNRSQTVDFEKGKLATWDLNSIMESIVSHYDSSLSRASELQLITIKQIDEILVDPKSKFDDYELKLRPTLYDFLAHRALDFYRSGEGDVLFPLDTFNINESFYQIHPNYSPIYIEQSAATGFKGKTLAIYENLMAFHHGNGNEAALNHLNINRLDYLKNNFELAEEDSLYLSALSQLKNSAKKSGATAELNHSLAQFYFQESLDEHGKEKKGQYRILAHKLAKENLDKFPESFGGQQSKALIKQLERQQLGFQTLNAFPIKDWFLINIEHQNIPVAYLKIIKSPHAALEYNDRDPEAKIRLYNSIPNVYLDTIKLQTKKDYLEHQDVYPLPKLSQGRYILILSNHPNFDPATHIVSYRDVWISNLSFISRTYNNKIELRSLDRISGQALRNLKVEAWKRNYEPSKREYVFVRQESKFTDHEGMVSFESPNHAANLIFLLSDGKDSLVSDEMYRVFNSSIKDQKRISSTFFLDRSIYRPGQTVYFKAIHVEEKNESKNLASGINSTVKLWDANGREVTSLELRTNGYGSISGFFVLPSSGLTGNFRIGNEYGQQFFSVEEYKRPTFKIEFDSIATAYLINSLVPISGKIIGYTGDPIAGAEVNYSVFRSVHYPYPYFSRGFFPRETEILIGNGTIQGNSAGEFDFEFLAKEKLGSNADPKGLYNFRISVAATARNGETQSSNLDIKLSDQGFYLQTDIPDVVLSDSLKTIKVSALNPSGVAIDETIHLQVQKIEAEGQLFIPKLFEQSESDLMDSTDFKHKFPYLAYSSEDEISSWPKSPAILKKSIPANNAISLPKLKSGIYYLKTSAIDQNSDTVFYEKYFRVYSLEKELPEEKAFVFFALNNKVEVGDTARFILGSSFKEASVFWDLEVNGKLLESKKIVLREEQKIIELPIKEIHRGGFSVHVNMVKQNRAFGQSSIIEVPYSNKKLKIELTKSKDEIKPSAEEEWEIKITDPEGKAAKAELLVSMYDASLDVFREHQWNFRIFDRNRSQLGWNLHSSFQLQYSINFIKEPVPYFEAPQHGFPYLNWYGFHLGYGRYYYGLPEMLAQEVSIQRDKSNPSSVEESLISEDMDAELKQMQPNLPQNENIAIRKNFKETVFFYPNLRADDSGNYSFKFKVPDALTEWNFMAFAHNTELQHGQLNEKTISKKDLMVFPNMPRFFRSGDSLLVSTKIVGNAENYMNGQVKIQFMDAINDSMEMKLLNEHAEIKYFKVKKGDPAIVQWRIAIPEQSGAVRYRITAKTENYSDGEEKVIPVLSNKILVTESMPMSIRGNSTEYFQMEKLFRSNKSKTLENHRLTFEFSANPMWYAIQALPYIMENESENSEKIFSRYFSNALSAHIVETHPEIEKVFKHWKENEPNALLSALEKNEELKSIALEESPWLMEAKNETERKARLAVLFDENRMSMEKRSAIQKLSALQLSNGGWPWFANGPDDRYITQYILAGFGELKKTAALSPDKETSIMLSKAVEYIDQRAYEDYLKSLKQDSIKQLGSIDIHYLFTRSFFPEIQQNSKTKKIQTLYLELLEENWLEQSIYLKAMTALILNRAGKLGTAKAILESLRQTAIVDKDFGMYWKENQNGFYWHQSKIETQAMLMKAFNEIESDIEAVEEMKIWLLKQKQTNNWGNSKATAQACYAIISTESKLSYVESKNLQIEIGKETIDPNEKETTSAYFKKIWDADEIKPNMANVKIKKESDGIAWGALYWQYFEHVDKVSHSGTALDIQKELFVEKIMDGSIKLLPIENNKVKIGDRIVVRIVLRTNQNMEYIHMKDMRASGLEPVETISMHKQQDGLFYYQSIKDASTNFFFNNLRKGIHVFEYSLIANVEGEFSNGITQVQCMYAPEFSSHSKSSEVNIQGNN